MAMGSVCLKKSEDLGRNMRMAEKVWFSVCGHLIVSDMKYVLTVYLLKFKFCTQYTGLYAFGIV